MPAATGTKNLPYPVGTDRVADGDDAMRRLAQSVDNMVQAGTVSIPFVAVNTNASATVTFPIPYSAAPVVTVSWQAGGSVGSLGQLSTAAATPTSFTVTGVRTSGAAPLNVSWQAVGPVAAVS